MQACTGRVGKNEDGKRKKYDTTEEKVSKKDIFRKRNANAENANGKTKKKIRTNIISDKSSDKKPDSNGTKINAKNDANTSSENDTTLQENNIVQVKKKQSASQVAEEIMKLWGL